MNLGGPEIIILLAVVLLLFGSSKVPKLARSLGSAKREFETAQKEGGTESEREAPTPVSVEAA